jgi:hypothetical protein
VGENQSGVSPLRLSFWMAASAALIWSVGQAESGGIGVSGIRNLRISATFPSDQTHSITCTTLPLLKSLSLSKFSSGTPMSVVDRDASQKSNLHMRKRDTYRGRPRGSWQCSLAP